MQSFKWNINPYEMRKMRTDFLFMSPHPWMGFARLLDIGGTFDRYNVSSTGDEADARAMYSDWRMVGEDLMFAMRETRRKRPEQLSLQLR
jgi:hypothetical protein